MRKRKRMKRFAAVSLAAATVLSMNVPVSSAQEVTAPKPYGPTPSDAQMKYYKDELAIFNHFGVNTYTDKEWGDGKEDPDIFNPVNLDTDQWIEAFKNTGFKRCLITAKHHDGFNLYPTSVTDHSVESSSWRDGKGDVLKEYYESCKKYDMDMGVYLSPWDQNLPSYSVDVPPDYNDTYVKQIEEIFENYSDPEHPIVEFWMDGACGDPETRPVYDIQRWWDKLEELNPDIVYQQNYGAPLRWVGNESGYASNTSWQTADAKKLWDDYFVRGIEDQNYLHNGEPYIEGSSTADTLVWSIPEVDVRIRDGWFYHANENPKTPEELTKIYFDSVGRGSPLLLNVAPNREGLIDQKDIDSLEGFHDILTNTFDVNYAEGSAAAATSVRGNHNDYSAAKAVDDDYDTYWTMDDGQTTGSITVELDKPSLIDVVEIQEYIPLGQRISSFTVDVRVNGRWMEYGEGGTIGYKRLVKGTPIKAEAVRVNITGSYAVPLINNIAAYKADERIEEEGVQIPGRIQAAEFQEKSGGLIAENNGPNGASNIGAIKGGDCAVYKNVLFTKTPEKFLLNCAGPGTPQITLRLDSVDGPVLATVDVEPTGDYFAYHTMEADVVYEGDLTGYHDIYLCLNSGLNITWFELTGANSMGFAADKLTVNEGESVDVTVTRSGKDLDNTASVTVTTEPDTAVHGRHFVHKQEVVTFAPGETEKTVTIETIDNEEKSGTVSFKAVLSNPSDNATIGSVDTVTISIMDNDLGSGVNAQWKMDEGEGTTITDTEGQYQGTLSAGVSWADGRVGGGLSFDGTSGYVNLGMEDLEGPWTVAVWVKRAQASGDNAVLLSGTEGEIKLEQYQNTQKVGITKFGVADEVFNYSTPAGTWTHLALVCDGENSTSLYANGEFVGTIDMAIKCPVSRIGANDKAGLDSAGYMAGTLDELKIYDHMLSADQIADIVEHEGGKPLDKNFAEAPEYDEESNELILPKVEGYDIEVFGSDNKATVSLDGKVTRPLETQTVKLLYRITNKEDGSSFTTEKNAEVTIPARENSEEGTNAKPNVIPELREWVGGTGEVDLTDARIVLGDEEFKAAADTLKEDYEDITGRRIDVVSGDKDSLKAGDIFLSKAEGEDMLGSEGYYLNIGGDNADKDYVEIQAIDNTGSLYGGISILQILKQDEDGRDTLPRGLVKDYPKFEQRGMHLDVARKWIPMEYLKDLAKQMSWYKLNLFAVHLSDNDIWEGLSTENGSNGAAQGWFRLECETFPELTSKQHYTKEEFRNFQYESMDLGINVIPELDTPGHALAYTQAWGEDTARYDNPKYLDVLNPQVLENTKALFDEYINGYNGGEPTFVGDYVNIGTDEYKTDGLPSNERTQYREGFRQYCNDLLEYVNSTGKEAVFWGSLTENSGETPVTTDAVMYAWYKGYANAKQSLDAGYRVISMEDQDMYIVPGGSSYPNQFGRAEHLYNNWLPNNNSGWAGNPAPEGHPRVLGGQFAVWNDFHGNGISVNDISYRIQHNLYAVAEKTWAGTQANETGKTYEDVKNLAAELGDAPNADFMYEVDKEVVDNELLKLDGKADNAAQAGAEVTGNENVTENAAGKNGAAIQFNGGASYITTDVKSPGFDWTAAMWLKPEADGVLMEGKTGTLRLEDGKLKYDVEDYTHTFDCDIQYREWTHLALTGTYEGVTLYINGEKFASLIGTPFPNWNVNSGCNLDDGRGYPVNEKGERTQRYYETLMLPMEVIGSKENAVQASVDELYIYDRVLTENEIIKLSGAEIPFNIALNKDVTVGNYHSASTEADRSGSKAVDGDLTSCWEFDLNNTDTNFIEIPLNDNESAQKVVIKQMVWGGLNRITDIRIVAVNDGVETDILPETAFDGGEIDAANQIATAEYDLGQSVKADAIKIYLTPAAAGPDDLVNIRELEVYGIVSDEPAEELSTAVLEYALELAKKADTTGVVESVVKRFEDAKTNAQTILDAVNAGDASVTQEMVDNAWRELIHVMQYLSFKQGDKTDLEKVIALAADIEGRLTSYVEEGQKEFTDALTAARKVYDSKDAMQTEVDQAWKDLLRAMANLRLKADKDALEELVSGVEEMDLSMYTEESVQVFRSALANAQQILADATLSEDDQSTVDAAEEKLASAKAGLETKQASVGTASETDDQKGSTTGKNINNTEGGNQDKAATSVDKATVKSAKTGDESALWLIAAAGLAALAATLAGAKKKR